MIILLHNSKCSKSRDALQFMKKSGKNFTLREYMKWPLSFHELEDLRDKLWMKAIEFTRINEPEFKQCKLTKNSSDTEILKAMANHPRLMERAIVFDEKRAVLCRPPEEVLKILK